MKTRLAALFGGAALIVVGCTDTTPNEPEPGIARVTRRADLVTHTFPSITYPSGVTNDGNSFYVTTLDGFRPTYLINTATATISGTISGGFNPRDVVYEPSNGLFMTDVDFFVALRRPFDGVMIDSFPIPWRGGGIAFYRDTLYVGNLDSDSVLVIWYDRVAPKFTTPRPVLRKFVPPVRTEAMVADSVAISPTVNFTTLWALSPFLAGWMTEFDTQGNFIRRCQVPYQPGPFGLGGLSLMRDTFIVAHPTGGDPTLGTTIHRVARTELVCVGALTADTIDIEPGHFPNRINPRAGGRVTVAALSNSLRDATLLIGGTVRFGRTGTEASPLSSSAVDVNGDGRLDAVWEFSIRSTGILCGDTSARLTVVGATPPFDASDSILTVGCRGGP